MTNKLWRTELTKRLSSRTCNKLWKKYEKECVRVKCVDKDRENCHRSPSKAMLDYLQEKIKTGNKKIRKNDWFSKWNEIPNKLSFLNENLVNSWSTDRAIYWSFEILICCTWLIMRSLNCLLFECIPLPTLEGCTCKVLNRHDASDFILKTSYLRHLRVREIFIKSFKVLFLVHILVQSLLKHWKHCKYSVILVINSIHLGFDCWLLRLVRRWPLDHYQDSLDLLAYCF